VAHDNCYRTCCCCCGWRCCQRCCCCPLQLGTTSSTHYLTSAFCLVSLAYHPHRHHHPHLMSSGCTTESWGTTYPLRPSASNLEYTEFFWVVCRALIIGYTRLLSSFTCASAVCHSMCWRRWYVVPYTHGFLSVSECMMCREFCGLPKIRNWINLWSRLNGYLAALNVVVHFGLIII
jgi:hypothetical protein